MPLGILEFKGELFEPLIGQKVPFLRPSPPGVEREPVELTLIEVNIAKYGGGPNMRQPFSLLFTLRDAPDLLDHFTHLLKHPDFEECELLINRVSVPELDKRDGTRYYEIVFS